jgi:hypothetical protein
MLFQPYVVVLLYHHIITKKITAEAYVFVDKHRAYEYAHNLLMGHNAPQLVRLFDDSDYASVKIKKNLAYDRLEIYMTRDCAGA